MKNIFYNKFSKNTILNNNKLYPKDLKKNGELWGQFFFISHFLFFFPRATAICTIRMLYHKYTAYIHTSHKKPGDFFHFLISCCFVRACFRFHQQPISSKLCPPIRKIVVKERVLFIHDVADRL